MTLDEQLAELLAQLGVVLEDPAEELAPAPPSRANRLGAGGGGYLTVRAGRRWRRG